MPYVSVACYMEFLNVHAFTLFFCGMRLDLRCKITWDLCLNRLCGFDMVFRLSPLNTYIYIYDFIEPLKIPLVISNHRELPCRSYWGLI